MFIRQITVGYYTREFVLRDAGWKVAMNCILFLTNKVDIYLSVWTQGHTIWMRPKYIKIDEVLDIYLFTNTSSAKNSTVKLSTVHGIQPGDRQTVGLSNRIPILYIYWVRNPQKYKQIYYVNAKVLHGGSIVVIVLLSELPVLFVQVVILSPLVKP